MITIKNGDLLEATEKVIGHQVNCFGIAGGLAYHMFEKYPDAENDYMQLTQRANPWAIKGMTQLTGQQKDGHIIANIFGQYQPGADYNPEILEEALEMLGTQARVMEWSVALPYKLSCGIAGGDWDEVLDIIERTMVGVDCVIYQREGDM